LRALREDKDLSRLETARAIKKRNEDSVRHFESGNRLIGELELEVLARFYGCSADVTAELEELYAYARKPGEFASFGLPETIVTYLDLERAARLVRTSQNLIIPGMLQVEPYMRRLFQLAKVDANVIDQQVRARLKRQERLRAPDPVQLIAVIAEEALLRCAQERQVGPAQLAQLIEFAGQENIEIRIIDLEAGMHAGMTGSFTCLTFPAGTVDDFAYQETASGGQLTELATTVRHLELQFNELRRQALGVNESLDLITQLAQR
jgi:transcriptional regulator with XRE-family HTH domain